MTKTLIEVFSSIPDPRRAEGKRTSLPQILCMVTISAMAGHTGYRPVADFCKSNAEVLCKELGLRHGVPSHVTFRQVLQQLDGEALSEAFNEWACADLEDGEAVSGDGKALRSTVSDKHGSSQDFQAVVSLFSQERGLVSCVGQYRNKEKGRGEVSVVKELIEGLKGKGLLISLDALHTKKDAGGHYRIGQPLPDTGEA